MSYTLHSDRRHSLLEPVDKRKAKETMSTKFNTEAVLSAVVSACEAAAIYWEKNMARDEMDMFEDEALIIELDEA